MPPLLRFCILMCIYFVKLTQNTKPDYNFDLVTISKHSKVELPIVNFVIMSTAFVR